MIKIILSLLLSTSIQARLYTFSDSDNTYRDVNTFVSSYRLPEGSLNFSKSSSVINFLTTNSKSIRYLNENYEVIQACTGALKELGIKSSINDTKCKDCLDVVIEHSYETEKTSKSNFGCSRFHNNTFCSTSTRTFVAGQRWVVFSVFKDKKTVPVHSVEVWSEGKLLAVPPVARELCISAFANFPKRIRRRMYKVNMKRNSNKFIFKN